MSCFCIKDFSYNITYNTCKRILYQDNSVWVNIPDTYDIRIKYPGYNGFKTIEVVTNGVTVINSISLGISTNEVNLPTGIYCIEVTNCNGDVITLDFLNTCIYECELSNQLSGINFLNCTDYKEDIERYKEIKLLLEGAHAKFSCDWCSKDEVKKILELIRKKLDNLSSNCKCK